MILDYPAFATHGQKAKRNIQNRELLKRFEQLDAITEKKKVKELAKEILDLVILQHKFKELAGASAAA